MFYFTRHLEAFIYFPYRSFLNPDFHNMDSMEEIDKNLSMNFKTWKVDYRLVSFNSVFFLRLICFF